MLKPSIIKGPKQSEARHTLATCQALKGQGALVCRALSRLDVRVDDTVAMTAVLQVEDSGLEAEQVYSEHVFSDPCGC